MEEIILINKLIKIYESKVLEIEQTTNYSDKEIEVAKETRQLYLGFILNLKEMKPI